MNPMRVGLLGLGVVGGGTWTVLSRNAEEIARRAGRRIEVTRAAVRDVAKARARAWATRCRWIPMCTRWCATRPSTSWSS